MDSSTAVLVEDDEVIARAIASSLQGLGYAVSIAYDVPTGLALVRSRAFDVAVLDVTLRAGTTSAEVAAALVERRTPILFLTGMSEPDLPPVPPSATVAYLAKPASRAAIGTTLGLLRAHAASQRELDQVRHLLAESQRLAGIGSFELDTQSGTLTWTDEMYRLFGVSRETFVPGAESFLALVHPDDRERVALGFAGATVDDAAYIDYTIIRPDGEVRRMRGAVDADTVTQRPSTVIGTVQDVTEKARAHSEREAMEQRVRVAHDANKAKTEFLAHMSHELRTPLNAVLGLSEALVERVFGELNPAQVQTLETIHKSGRHLLELINDVLDIARVEAGKLSIELEQTMLRPVIDETTTLMSSTFASRKQRLVIELAPAQPPVDLDRRRMRQVLINLLTNASKFSPDNATITLRVTVDSARREIAVAVSDHGAGIAPENIERIFEPFVTIDPLLTRKHDGAGLGLALAKQLTELHRGRLVVDSVLGEGTTFSIVLPVSAGYVEPPAIPRTRTGQGSAGTVLLVEDNEATVLAVRTYLESRGFGIRVVGNGEAVLTAVSDVVLVLMDIQLPGLDGLEVTRRLRARGFTRPIIALTAYAMPDDEARCLAAGASAYMSKPVRLRQLADTIDRLLEPQP